MFVDPFLTRIVNNSPSVLIKTPEFWLMVFGNVNFLCELNIPVAFSSIQDLRLTHLRDCTLG